MMWCWYARFVVVLLRVVRATVSGGCGRMCCLGVWVRRERVARLMRQETLQARPPRRRLPRDLGERPVKALGAEQAGPAVCGESAG